MKKVIFIEQPKEETKKPVEFTHYLSETNGWVNCGNCPSAFDSVVYLGKSMDNGDMFAANNNINIYIYKGHLNSGEY